MTIGFPQQSGGLSQVVVEPTTKRVLVAGSTFNGVDMDVFVARYSPQLSLEWSSSFCPTGVANEWLSGADIAPSGDVVVAGTSNHAGVMDWFVFRYHFAVEPAPGSSVLPVWGRYFTAGTQVDGPDAPFGVHFDAFGNSVVVGVAEIAGSGQHRMVDVRYSAQGQLLAGSPSCASGWSGGAADQVFGWAFDPACGASAMVGFKLGFEPGYPGLLPDWAVWRSGY